MSEPMFLKFNEVIERYRGQISEGTSRNWLSMGVCTDSGGTLLSSLTGS